MVLEAGKASGLNKADSWNKVGEDGADSLEMERGRVEVERIIARVKRASAKMERA